MFRTTRNDDFAVITLPGIGNDIAISIPTT